MDKNLATVGVIALAAGAGLGAYYYLRPKLTVAPQPTEWQPVNFAYGPSSGQQIAWPQNQSVAPIAVQELDAVWWTQLQSLGIPLQGLTTSQWSQTMTNAHYNAVLIRQQYPNASIPATGYTCGDLISAGKLPSNFNCPPGL